MDRRIEKKSWTTRRIVWLIAGVGLLAVVAYTVWGADFSSKLNIEKEKLSIAVVKKGPFGEFITVDGAVVPRNTIFLDAVEGGVVERKIAEDGAEVKKGDTLLVLSNGNLQLDYINRETAILDLLNQIENARASMQQSKTAQLGQLADIEFQHQTAGRKQKANAIFVSQQAIARNEYEGSEDEFRYLDKKQRLLRHSLYQDSLLTGSRIRQMDFSVQRMKENLALVRKNLQSLIVRSPMDGQLTSFDIQQGQLISQGQNLGQISGKEGFKIRLDIDEHYVSRVYPGQKGTFDFDSRAFTLTISKVNPQVKNGLFQADMLFEENPPAGLRKGQNLNIRLELSAQTTAILLEKGGFSQVTGGNWAFVLSPDGKEAGKRNIKAGRQNPDYFEILDGLQPGDKVIVSSYTGFENKQKIILK